MLPHLIKAGTPESASRLIIVSSEVHFLAHTLKGADKWDGIIEKLNDQAYCTSR
jgi:retinol dehydrogenase-12